LFGGSPRHLLRPFGIARNGVIVTASSKGEVISVDPASGAARTLDAGPNLCCVRLSPDGLHVAYFTASADTTISLRIANVDGSNAHQLPAAAGSGDMRWLDWSPSSDRVLVTWSDRVSIIDVAT